MKAIGGPSDLLQSTEGLACRPSCWRIGNPPVTACVHESTGSAPAEAGEPTASRSALAAAARCRASSHHASRRRQARPPVFAISSGTACPKSEANQHKKEHKALSPSPLSLSPVPRESRSRPRRGEAAARHLSNGIPVLPPCNLCKSPLIPSSLLRPLASCWPGMVAPAASLSSCPSCRRFSSAEAPCP